jgi:hypothetical protein
MGIASLQNRKAPAMERARRVRVDRTPVRVTYRSARAWYTRHEPTYIAIYNFYSYLVIDVGRFYFAFIDPSSQ